MTRSEIKNYSTDLVERVCDAARLVVPKDIEIMAQWASKAKPIELLNPHLQEIDLRILDAEYPALHTIEIFLVVSSPRVRDALSIVEDASICTRIDLLMHSILPLTVDYRLRAARHLGSHLEIVDRVVLDRSCLGEIVALG